MFKRKNAKSFFLSTGSFTKVKSNNVVEAEPSELHFSGFEVGKDYKKVVVCEVVLNSNLKIHTYCMLGLIYQAGYKHIYL